MLIVVTAIVAAGVTADVADVDTAKAVLAPGC
jgi:hypothetical protein